MKRIYTFLFVTMAMLMLSVSSAWAQYGEAYVKLTAEDETVSWIKIIGNIYGTNIHIGRPEPFMDNLNSAIDEHTMGSIDLNEVWSESGGKGEHYQVTAIGLLAFYRCSGLISVDIPSGATYIDDQAFWGCSGLTSVNIPSSVISIGWRAFSGCSGLTSVVIPSNVTSIDQESFQNCSSLTSVVIPSSVTFIHSQAFQGCNKLKIVTINNNNILSQNSSLINLFGSQVTKYVLGTNVTSIGNYAFRGCSGLTSIDIPSSVTSIGDYAFSGCSGLNSIDIPSNVTNIENYMFSGCSGLTSVDIPSNVTSIGDYAFSGCVGLTSVNIPSGVNSIGNLAFQDCSCLTSVYLPSNVASIGQEAFRGCIGLTSIVVESGNSVYDSRNNCNAIIETASNSLIAGCKNTKIPSSVTSIGDYAFYYCSGLTSVEIPSSVTSIGGSAFYGCSGLSSIVIPSSVTNIGGGAFRGCSGLISVSSYITNIFETGTNAFSGCDNATLYVPKGLGNFYRITADWNRFKKVEEMQEVIPGTIVVSCNNKGKVLINGTTEFTNDVGEVSVYDGVDNTFVFTPEENCQLEQVLIDGLDVTLSVKNNQLTTKVHEGSKMIVTFSKSSGDMNGDGQVNISDVVALVNLILGQ